MNQLYDLMQIIKTSEQRGQELMIDSFVIGYLFGKGILKNEEELITFIKQLNEIKNQMDQSLKFPSIRDEFLLQKLENLQFLQKNEKNDEFLLQKQENLQFLQKNEKNDEKKQKIKTEKKQGKKEKKKNNLIQTTPINTQIDIKDQNELIQEEEGEKQQNQRNPKKCKGQQPQKCQQGVQTRQQLAQSNSEQQEKEQQKNE